MARPLRIGVVHGWYAVILREKQSTVEKYRLDRMQRQAVILRVRVPPREVFV
jgi:hypothetical protein